MKIEIKANKIGSVLNADRMDVRIVRGSDANAVVAEAVPAPRARVDIEQIVDELAAVFPEREQAVVVADRAGVPRSRLPSFTTALAFWTHVVADARNGMLAGGVQPLLDAAGTLFPDNEVFSKAPD